MLTKDKEGNDMYRIALCDDNQEYMELMAEQIRAYGETRGVSLRVDEFSDSDLLMDWIETKRTFDVYILDIEMPYHSGIDLARRAKEISHASYIIFLTAYDEFAIEACGMDIFRYVLKQSAYEKIDGVLDELFHHLKRLQDDHMYIIRNSRKFIRIPYRDILYIYKDQKNAVFVLADGRIEKERLSLQEVYQKIDAGAKQHDMFFLDRGIILNLSHISRRFQMN